jgi:protein-L-isoaspartate(D-aspartate) O-methyltransferase
MHAHAAESLLPFLKPGARVLDVGSGSGYLTHVFAELVFPSHKEHPQSSTGPDHPSQAELKGRVVGLEHIQALRDLGDGNMRKSEEGKRFLNEGKVEFVKGDGRKGWVEDGGGWDAIHVGAAAVKLHEELVEQLKSPGR